VIVEAGPIILASNRLSVMLQWALAHLTFQRSVRLITDSSRTSDVSRL